MLFDEDYCYNTSSITTTSTTTTVTSSQYPSTRMDTITSAAVTTSTMTTTLYLYNYYHCYCYYYFEERFLRTFMDFHYDVCVLALRTDGWTVDHGDTYGANDDSGVK